MNRIAMLEKGIPFELQNEIPWHQDETKTPQYNPLEKLPILLSPGDPNFEPVYDSAHIQEYIVQKFADKEPKLLTGNVNLDLKARQIQVLSEGMLDAFVLEAFEKFRPEAKQSEEWSARQNRKVDGGMRAFDELARNRKGEFLVGDGKTFTIADIAVACAVGQIDFTQVRPGWQEKYPELANWFKSMDEKEHFASTRPFMFDLKPHRVVGVGGKSSL
jgi:glutathione S-transferase